MCLKLNKDMLFAKKIRILKDLFAFGMCNHEIAGEEITLGDIRNRIQ